MHDDFIESHNFVKEDILDEKRVMFNYNEELEKRLLGKKSTYFEGKRSPLHKAAIEKMGNLCLLQRTMNKPETDLDETDSNGDTVLHMVSAWFTPNAGHAVSQVLIMAPQLLEVRNHDNQRPIHLAAGTGHISAMKPLLDAKTLLDDPILSPLNAALHRPSLPHMATLLEAGANPTFCCKFYSNSPFHMATSQNRNIEILKVFMPFVKNIDSYRPGWETPLMYAIKHYETEAMQYLLENGANADLALKLNASLLTVILHNSGCGDNLAWTSKILLKYFITVEPEDIVNLIITIKLSKYRFSAKIIVDRLLPLCHFKYEEYKRICMFLNKCYDREAINTVAYKDIIPVVLKPRTASLKHLSRKAVRKNLKVQPSEQSLLVTIENLEIPMELKSYLRFS